MSALHGYADRLADRRGLAEQRDSQGVEVFCRITARRAAVRRAFHIAQPGSAPRTDLDDLCALYLRRRRGLFTHMPN
jgi:hypothetical protein